MVGKMHPPEKIDPRGECGDTHFVGMQCKLQPFSEKCSDISLYFEQRCFVVRKKYKIIGIPYVVLYFELMLHELVEFVHVDIDQ